MISRVHSSILQGIDAIAGEVEADVPGSLPSSLEIRNSRIGAGSLFALFSAVYVDMISRTPGSDYEIPAFDPYPRTNEKEIVQAVRELKSWPVHRPDLDMEKIVELTKLQLWTLKPAHRRALFPDVSTPLHRAVTQVDAFRPLFCFFHLNLTSDDTRI